MGQPLSAMHFASSTTTGTDVFVVASGMICLLLRLRRHASGRRVDALLVVEIFLVGGDRHDIGGYGALLAGHSAILLAQERVAEPVLVVLLGIVGPQVIEAPAALGAVERSVRGHIGAVEDRGGFERAPQFGGVG